MTERGAALTVTPSTHSRGARSLVVRLLVTAGGLALWFWTQSLIGARTLPDAGVGDGLHILTAPLNEYLHAHPATTNALLIVSSSIIDLH